MNSREEIITQIQEGLRTGLITESDIKSFIHEPALVPVEAVVEEEVRKSERLSAVDIMFYVAGIVLYSALLSIIAQSWDSTGDTIVLHVFLSAGIGMMLWAAAYYLIKDNKQTDVKRGLINALLLTGSLSVVTGGYIISNQLVGGFGEINFVAGAITLAVVGGLHLAFDRLIRRDLTLLMGVLFSVAAFPALLFGLLKDTDAPGDVLVLVGSAGLLAYATRVVTQLSRGREGARHAFDAFAAFLALIAMYISSFGDYGSLWLIGLLLGVLGIFYLSVMSQNRHLLGNASFFLVLTVITISFKYFSGFGVTTSLIMATIGLLGSAAVASSINKKYFKRPL